MYPQSTFHRVARVGCLILLSAVSAPIADAQVARITEERRVFDTYPFSEPNRVPIFLRDDRLYPYHSFDGYAHKAVQREWKVVHLQNDLIDVYVLPEVGGKVWGAIVKSTGHEFIYRNEVMKFRNIALRGPWTSGGIEFNFGVIGHTPATATPVDYVVRTNADGSVSCIVGTMDLPSRTHWRVEIRLPKDRAYFETNVLWYNPTPLEQPYYNWMTGAAFARQDLELSIPGNAYLEHGGKVHPWPTDSASRYLPWYANNTFAGHKSYHVVGELNDFFGGYYRDAGWGFGHWARHDEMPGQKQWLWALSREGGIWERLLTDTDGQYVEFQAGRLLVQYAPGNDITPVTQAGFEPGAADKWSERWFPVEGLGGLSAASGEGAMHVTRQEDTVSVSVHAFGHLTDTMQIRSGEQIVKQEAISFRALRPVVRRIVVPAGAPVRIEFAGLNLSYDLDPRARELSRPFRTDSTAVPTIPAADRLATEGRELSKGRRYAAARDAFERVLIAEPWHRAARLSMAELEYRRARYVDGLEHVRRVLQLDAYDARANFVAGTLYRAVGQHADARDAFGWASRSMTYRSVAYVQLAELSLVDGNLAESTRYAALALDYDRNSLAAKALQVIIARKRGELVRHRAVLADMRSIDPLHHFAAAEEYLLRRPGAGPAFQRTLRSEYPEQTVLELAIDYARRGAVSDARAILGCCPTVAGHPMVVAWRAFLAQSPADLPAAAELDLVFPYREESLPVLQWVVQERPHWTWQYLLALNLRARDRVDEAAVLLERMANAPTFAPLYITRASMLDSAHGRDPEPDLRRAVLLDSMDRMIRVQLVRHLQSKGRWAESLIESEVGRTRFAGDFNLDLLHVRSLNYLNRFDEAVTILAQTEVLPSEDARESHALYEHAHLLASLNALSREQWSDARAHAHAAMEWPEHLGQGRPYQPEERLAQLVLGIAEQRLGNRPAADAALLAVVNAHPAQESSLDLLRIRALALLGRDVRSVELPGEPGSPLRRLAESYLNAVATRRSSVVTEQALESVIPGIGQGMERRLLSAVLKVLESSLPQP